jgi:membrane-associated phospholipid phosphatase
MAGFPRIELARLALHRYDLDRWAVVYLLASALYPLLRPARDHATWERLALHALLAAAVWFLPPLARRSRHGMLRLAGEVYLPFIFPLFYSEMEQLGLVFFDFHASLDPHFIALEEALFGFQPSLEWSRVWPWPWFHELMEFAYFSYYLVALVVLVMLLKAPGPAADERWPALRAFVRDLSATMLVCYTLYTFFPVWGPKYFRAGPVEVPGWIFTRIMEHIHAHGAILGAAFPSSHVAATLIPWWHVWKWFPRHRWWMTALFLCLCAATVYCRYHYVVDVVGGLLLGSLILVVSSYFRERGARAVRRTDTPRPRQARRGRQGSA